MNSLGQHGGKKGNSYKVLQFDRVEVTKLLQFPGRGGTRNIQGMRTGSSQVTLPSLLRPLLSLKRKFP